MAVCFAMNAPTSGFLLLSCLLCAFICTEGRLTGSDVWNDVTSSEYEKGSPTDAACKQCSCNQVTKSCDCCGSWIHKFKIFFKMSLTARLDVKPLPSHYGVELLYRLNNKEEYHRNASMKYPPRICTKVPGYPHILTKSWVCLEFKDVDTCKRYFCAHITGYIKILFKTYPVYAKLGCATLPEVPGDTKSHKDVNSNDLEFDDLEFLKLFSISDDTKLPVDDTE